MPPAAVEAARDLDARPRRRPPRSDDAPATACPSCCCGTGRVYPEPIDVDNQSTGGGSASQRFPEPVSELAFADLLAAVDGLSARKAALAERLSRLAHDEPAWWPTVARLRCFRGVDTLTALALHLELGGDWQRFTRAPRLRRLAGAHPVAEPVGRVAAARARSPRPARAWRAGCWSRPPGTTPANRAIGATLRNRQQGQPDHVLQIANRAQQRLHRVHHNMRAPRQTRQRRQRRRRPRTGLLPLGRRHRSTNPPRQPSPVGEPGRRANKRPARAIRL